MRVYPEPKAKQPPAGIAKGLPGSLRREVDAILDSILDAILDAIRFSAPSIAPTPLRAFLIESGCSQGESKGL